MIAKRKKKQKKISNKNGLAKIATITTKSISSAFSSYKKNKELEKIRLIKLQKIEEKNQILRERKDLRSWEERLSKESNKIRNCSFCLSFFFKVCKQKPFRKNSK